MSGETTKSYTQMRNEFYENYQKKILPKVRLYENERKNKNILSIIIIILTTMVSAAMFGSIIYYKLSDDFAEIVGKIACGIFILGIASRWCIKKEFENSIKSKIMPIVCPCFGDMNWSHTFYNEKDFIKQSYVIPEFTSSSCDDIFIGAYKNVPYHIVESKYEVGSGRNRHVVFEGVIVRIDMNKNFAGHTVIRPDSLFHKASGVGKLRHTTLEDVVFEKKFDVFTDDEVEARYLITPSFMQRLNGMKTAFKAQKVSCAFYKTHLFVALHTPKDLFSLCSLTKPIDDSKQYFEMYEEMVSIVKLIDHFKLDQKIGL